MVQSYQQDQSSELGEDKAASPVLKQTEGARLFGHFAELHANGIDFYRAATAANTLDNVNP